MQSAVWKCWRYMECQRWPGACAHGSAPRTEWPVHAARPRHRVCWNFDVSFALVRTPPEEREREFAGPSSRNLAYHRSSALALPQNYIGVPNYTCMRGERYEARGD